MREATAELAVTLDARNERRLETNQLYRWWSRCAPSPLELLDVDTIVRAYRWRRRLVRHYAWAVPSPEALELIDSYGPIVEHCAGSGYWAALLRRIGADVVSYDLKPWRRSWGEVLSAEPSVLKDPAVSSDRALLLVWPPYSERAGARCVSAYRKGGGKTVLYVGEGAGGCTGDDLFHRMLESERLWRLDRVEAIPQWDGIHDRLFVYRRDQS